MRKTASALLMSAISLLLCCAMLVGTTFAWFSDSAGSGVNKIVAGNLDIALEMKEGENWVSAEGKTLQFVKADGAPETEAVLWEPGCTYNLQQVRVVNNGTLALKYTVAVSGISGADKLNSAIEWTVTVAGETFAAGTVFHLAAGAAAELSVSGHMKETAGNEYRNLEIRNAAITVAAAQDTVEADSFNNQYDKDAGGTNTTDLPYLTFSSESEFKLGIYGEDGWPSPRCGWTTIDGSKLEYSTDAQSWTEWKWDETKSISSGEAEGGSGYVLYLRGKMPDGTMSGILYGGRFPSMLETNFSLLNENGTSLITADEGTGKVPESKWVYCTGNIMTLLDYENPNGVTMGENAFSNLFFNCFALRTAPTLPATELAPLCYNAMFNNCISLERAPALPATTLANSCYLCMFFGCTSLETAPALPSDTLKASCYQNMFCDCKNLNVAACDKGEGEFVTIPSSEIPSNAVFEMFKGTANASGIGTDGTPAAGTSYKIATP